MPVYLQSMAIKVSALIICLNALPLMVGLTGCAGDRYNQSTSRRMDDDRAPERGDNRPTDRGVEDRRTAERVREALAASADYRYDGVRIKASNGVVQLRGFVSTAAQRNRAGEVASKVMGVTGVENNLMVEE
jgi:osmotically-inducible protein OsmY